MSAPIDEARLAEIEARANETVLRCRAGDDCDAPARWRDPSAVAWPSHDEDWFCDAHVVKRVDSFRIDAIDLDALDLVAEVRRLTAALDAAEGRAREITRRVRLALGRWGVEDCDDVCAALDECIEESERRDREAADRANDLAIQRDEARAALATARREGAEEMRERLAAIWDARAAEHDATVDRWLERGEANLAVHYKCRAQRDRAEAAAIRALPLDAPGVEGASS